VTMHFQQSQQMLTANDVKAIRAHAARARFVHAVRIASEWGISVLLLETLVPNLRQLSRQQQK
jgi:hypothetical protein